MVLKAPHSPALPSASKCVMLVRLLKLWGREPVKLLWSRESQLTLAMPPSVPQAGMEPFSCISIRESVFDAQGSSCAMRKSRHGLVSQPEHCKWLHLDSEYAARGPSPGSLIAIEIQDLALLHAPTPKAESRSGDCLAW